MWRSGREAKNLVAWGVWRWWCQRPQERKFFASFFQKRSSFLASFDTRVFAGCGVAGLP
jgi:hypothetical protein